MKKLKSINDLAAAILLYCCVIVYQGYQYGQSDQSQILPVIYELDHPGTYTNDHYVSHYISSGTNERTIYQAVLRYLGYDVPWLVFLWHAIASVFLILAWVKISGKYIENNALRWLTIGFILIVAYHTATGSNEIYYNQLVPSLPAKALASWALYHWLQGKYWRWVFLLIIAGYLQPLVGLHVFLITTAALLVSHIHKQNWNQIPWKELLLYLIATLPWIYLLATHNGGQENPEEFIGVLEFRLSHHFFGSYFSKFNLIMSFLFMAIALAYYSEKLRWMFGFIILGIVVYEIGAEVISSPLIIYTQWWKTTIWVEAFAIIAIASWTEKRIRLPDWLRRNPFIIPVSLLTLVIIYRWSGIRGTPPYMSPLPGKENHELNISRRAKELSPADALFIIPPEITSFRWYGQRSTYIDYKAMLHTESFLYDWRNRIDEVYHYNPQAKASGATVYSQARLLFNAPNGETIAFWKSKGISHFISYTPDLTSVKKLGGNATYTIYQLP